MKIFPFSECFHQKYRLLLNSSMRDPVVNKHGVDKND